MACQQLDLLNACIGEVARTLKDREEIVELKRGLTMFSRNAKIPFLLEIATLDGTGQVTGAKRVVVALVTSNSPHQVEVLPTADLPSVSWIPL